MSNGILKCISRYVVPFYYDEKGNQYDEIRDYLKKCNESDFVSFGLPKDGKWVEKGFWESDKKGQPEMDIYSYLPDLFNCNNDIDATGSENLGTSFMFEEKEEKFEPLIYEYKDKDKDGTENRLIKFHFVNLGIVVFKNGIGFIWYEIGIDSDVSADEYLIFQNKFKELSRTHTKSFYKDKECESEKKDYFCTGKWLSTLLSSERMHIFFWGERATSSNGENKRIPDKALLYQFILLDNGYSGEISDFVFRVTNGYDSKYNVPNDAESRYFRPFGNASCYITKSGMSYIAENNETNIEFFVNQFPSRFGRDYFFIFVLLSYQAFSCANYSRILSRLPSKEEELSINEIMAGNLEKLNGHINLFLVKSVFESVSNIDHQDEFYRYGKRRLNIEEDLRSLTFGLRALRDLEMEKRDREEQREREEDRQRREDDFKKEQAAREEDRKDREDSYKREQDAREEERRNREDSYKAEQDAREKERQRQEERDGKLNRGLAVFGTMVVLSALIDGLNLVDWFMNAKSADVPFNLGHGLMVAIVVGLSTFLIYTFWKNKDK